LLLITFLLGASPGLSTNSRIYLGWFELGAGEELFVQDQRNFPTGLKKALSRVGIHMRGDTPCWTSLSATFVGFKKDLLVVDVACNFDHSSDSIVFKYADGRYHPFLFKVRSPVGRIETVVGRLPNVSIDQVHLGLRSTDGGLFCDGCGGKEELDEAHDKVTSYYELNSRNDFELMSVKQHSHSGKLRRVLWERDKP